VILFNLAEFAGPLAILASERLRTRRKVLPLELETLTSAYMYLHVERATNQSHDGVGLAFLLEPPFVKRDVGSRLFEVRGLCVLDFLLRLSPLLLLRLVTTFAVLPLLIFTSIFIVAMLLGDGSLPLVPRWG